MEHVWIYAHAKKRKRNMNDCKLILAEIRGDVDCGFYMKLVYTYTDELGKHELTFPNVELPFSQRGLPDIIQSMEGEAFLIGEQKMRLFEGFVYWSKEMRCFFDRITEPKVHRMTLEEIEKELGYKVEIVT